MLNDIVDHLPGFAAQLIGHLHVTAIFLNISQQDQNLPQHRSFLLCFGRISGF